MVKSVSFYKSMQWLRNDRIKKESF
jgi:hypothetical protein